MMRLLLSRLAGSRVIRRWLVDSTDAVARERLRIACELHDVVAHDLSVMTLGVGAGRVIMDRDPERARQTLREAEDSGRQVLSDLQRMLGLLRVEGVAVRGPQPRLADLPALIDGCRAGGLAVTLREDGVRAGGPVLELSVYRIVEESLRNAVLHGHATAATVGLRWLSGVLEISVRDDGLPRERLLAIWERAALFGGSVAARPVPGGFEVRVRLLLTRTP
ncbi:MAG TPA: histidine kinase [Trebonia sp.]